MTPIAVIGAGVAGLAAAYELARTGIDVLVLEAEGRAGGVIVTEAKDGFLVEGGPDGFLAADPEIPALAGALGIGDRLIGQAARRAWQWTGSRLEPLAEGEGAQLLELETRGADLAAGFRSFEGGMGQLVEGLVSTLGARLRYRVGVTAACPSRGGYRLSATGGSTIEASDLVVALPAYAAARILLGIAPDAAHGVQETRYHPSLTVSLAYARGQVAAPLDGTGFVVAAEPDRGEALRACTFASSKFAGRAPDGHVLVRAFLRWGEGEAVALAHRSLAPILGITGEPLWARVFYWPRGLPEYSPGHAERLAYVRARLEEFPGVALAGAGFDGPGVGACVRSGRAAARALLTRS